MNTVFDAVKKFLSGNINDGVAQMMSISAIPKEKNANQISNKNQESATRTTRQVVHRNETSGSPNIFKQTILEMTKFFVSLLFRNDERKNPNMMNNVTIAKESSKNES